MHDVVRRHQCRRPASHRRSARSTAFLRGAAAIVLVDVVIAETVYVLQSVYRVTRFDVARLMRSIVTSTTVVVSDVVVLLRTLEIYEVHRLNFADAYLVACTEAVQGSLVSFDRAISRVRGVDRLEP